MNVMRKVSVRVALVRTIEKSLIQPNGIARSNQ